MAENEVRTDVEFIATEVVASNHFHIVVLRDDQLDLIREVVREEIQRGLQAGGS